MTDGRDGPGALADLDDGGDGPADADAVVSPGFVVGFVILVGLVVAVGGVVAWTLFTAPACACERATTPQVAVDVAYDDANGTVRATHAGGDTLDAGNTDRLRVVVENRTGATVTGRSLTAFPYGAGDTFVADLDARPGWRVLLVWSGPVGEHYTNASAVLAAFEVPVEFRGAAPPR